MGSNASSNVDIRQLGPECLERYGRISIAFMVTSVLRVEQIDGGLDGVRLIEEDVAEPYEKDYDAYEDEHPARWRRFDLSNWGFFMAFDGSAEVVSDTSDAIGAAAVAVRSAGVNMLEGRNDLAVLWDIRVRPDCRRRGIGTSLFRHAVNWAKQFGCRQLKIETQNINVAACRFYARQGCHLGRIDRYGYTDPRIAHETMLLWHLDL